MEYACSLLLTSAVWLLSSVATATPRNPTSYSKTGDVIIGGLFPLHYESKRPDNYSLLVQPAPVECIRYNFLGFQWMQAMVFAIEQINNRSDFLPNIKLGYEIFDTCNTLSRAVNQVIHISEKNQNPLQSNISAVIGPTGSTLSIVTSNILSIYDTPQISHASTSRILGDKTIYNSFFRTIPNDDEQTKAILDLLLYHNWTWVGAIAGDDDYGRPGIAKLKEMARTNNICIEYTGYISNSKSPEELLATAEEVRDFNATVFVLFVSTSHLQKFAGLLSVLEVYDKVWIASEAWATSNTIREIDARLFEGTLGIAERGGPMPNFREFLQNVSPSTQPENPFIHEFWEQAFNCTCNHCDQSDSSSYFVRDEQLKTRDCLSLDNLTLSASNTGAYLDWTGMELEKSYNVYLAVLAIAHALEDIMNCTDGNGLLENGTCPNIATLQTWQLLAYLKQVNFVQPGQDLPFYFDQSGDPYAAYKIVNWQPRNRSSGSTEIDFVDVGYYSMMTSPTWTLLSDKFYWNHNLTEVPLSVCTGTCLAGFYRVRLSSVCCFECRECPMNEISTKENSPSCEPCDPLETSSANKTACIPKLREYVCWNDGFGITFACLVGIGCTLTLFCAIVFFKHRATAMVKATNVEISFLLLISIAFCFLTPLFYIAEPEDWSCQARMITFSLSFTMSVAAILVKTLRVLAAFEAKVPVRRNKKSRCLGEHLQILVVFCITFLQLCLCIAWLIVEPPVALLVPSLMSSDTLLLECTNGSLGLMISVYVYLSILAGVAFVLAFRARKLPENFNEAKFITFSMLIFFIVWCSFIPAYLTTRGLMTTVVYCIAIFASTFGMLSCIFFPKLYVILITPERNTKINVRACTATHAIRSVHKETVRNHKDNLNASVQDQRAVLDFGLNAKNNNKNNNNSNNNSEYCEKRNKYLDNVRNSETFFNLRRESRNSNLEFYDSGSSLSIATMQSSLPDDTISDSETNAVPSKPNKKLQTADSIELNTKHVKFQD